ncbi:hypothetical protein QUB60_24330 [Microcoleus sp. A2-C5]|uniref:hypothetical protein n=1 Tax=unclassified Microcoleus TaxID=2642155 RepID=UPI002FD0BDFF
MFLISIIGTLTCAIALDRATPSSATRDRLTSEIIRSQDARCQELRSKDTLAWSREITHKLF